MNSICTCGRIKVGSTVTDSLNWNPDCIQHGTKSEWWTSPEQVARRNIDRERLTDLQHRASQARSAARLLKES